MSPEAAAPSQTLSRGIRLLELLAESPSRSVDQLAAALDVHRSIAYRLLRTLQHHGLVTRDGAGRYALGPGLAALAAGVARDVQQAALPELDRAATELGATCLLAVMDDEDEAVTLASAAPRRSVAAVSYRPGHRHPITRGAPGRAILLGLPTGRVPAELRDGIERDRRRGYAVSRGEVVPALTSVAVPLPLPGRSPAAVAMVHVSLPRPEAEVAERLRRAADAIAAALGG